MRNSGCNLVQYPSRNTVHRKRKGNTSMILLDMTC